MNTENRVQEILEGVIVKLSEALVLLESGNGEMGEYHQGMIERLSEHIRDLKGGGSSSRYYDQSKLLRDMNADLKHHFRCLQALSVRDAQKVTGLIYTSVAKAEEKRLQREEASSFLVGLGL